MAPTKSRAVWLREWISRIEEIPFIQLMGRLFFVKLVNRRQQAPATQFFQLNQHNSTEKHKANVERREKKQIKDNSTWQDLAYIHSNFGELPQSIVRLEKQGLSIHEALEVFANVRNKLDSAIGDKE
uniref:Uncharacterized protein n=1 Tax=Meloidogyne incognita TaxID=6306 RepID=A0A914L2G1_MELIC